MTRKAIIVMSSSVSALLAMGTGVNSYQQTQRDQREALKATVVAMQFFDGALERVKTSIGQSSDMREDLIRQTDALLKDTVTTEHELLEHGSRIAGLSKKRSELSLEAARILSDAKAAMSEASDAVGECRRIVQKEKLKASQAARIEDELRAKTKLMQEVRAGLDRFESLVGRCESLAGSLQLYAEQNRTALERMQAIKRQTEERLSLQRARQAAAQEVSERLSRVQAELKQDLESIQPKN